MSKRQPKSQASSARAAATAYSFGISGFRSARAQLSYLTTQPDLSSISDPNAVVYFRNLSKKDSTTKAKALEDLQAFVSALQQPVEDAVLEAWIHVYPRTSIENSKAVRQNAHLLHGQMAVSAGKRMARHMGKSVGAWLSGLYDSDRSVVEAAQSSLRLCFATPEKIQSIRKAYQQPILQYCRDAIDTESPETLSDERTVSPDDAQAKYSRVISACIALVGSLLVNLKPDELAKFQSDYDGLLSDAKVWAFASHKDVSIRKALHGFLQTCITKQPEAVTRNLDTISKAYLANALKSDQTSSATNYLEALTSLTSTHPTAWTHHYYSKTSVDRRLRQFLKKGSQTSPPTFWDRLVDLFKVLPSDVLPKTAPDAAELLGALHGGIVKKDELRLYLDTKFAAYLDVASIVCKPLSEQDQRKVLTEMVLPIISHHLHPSPETSQWEIPPNCTWIAARASEVACMPAVLGKQWPIYVDRFVGDIKTSAPEQSKDYDRSQNALLQQARRFTALHGAIMEDESSDSLRSIFEQACASVISEALAVVKNRNGKPYGAAGAVVEFLDKNKALVLSSQKARDEVSRFARADLASLILSPSYSHLVDLLYALVDLDVFETAWKASLDAVLAQPDSPVKAKALEAMLSSPKIPSSFDLASSDVRLQDYVKSQVKGALSGSLKWDDVGRILWPSSTILSPSSTDELLSMMTQSLSLSQPAASALEGFRSMTKHNPALLKSFISTPNGSGLVRGLLLASESPDETTAQEAASLNNSIQTILAAESVSKHSMLDVIHQGLKDASRTSVSVETLVELAKQLIKSNPSREDISALLPNNDDWDSALNPFLDAAPHPSLAVTNPLGGAVYLVEPNTTNARNRDLAHDADGYSVAFRIAQYVAGLLKHEAFNIDDVAPPLRNTLLWNIALTVQLADDNLGLAGSNDMWVVYNPEVEAEVMSFTSSALAFVVQELRRQTDRWRSDGGSPLLAWSASLLERCEEGRSPRTYYTARTYSVLVSRAIELAGWNVSQSATLQEFLKTLRKSKQVFPLIGFLVALKEPFAASQSCERMCNELVADLTGLDIESKPELGLEQLVLLNTILYGQDCIAYSIAKTRLIFFVKHIVAWLSLPDLSLSTSAELCRTLAALLPLMSDVYGQHWSDILSSIAGKWAMMMDFAGQQYRNSGVIPFIHASLKLYAQLRVLAQAEDPNDDLLEVWKGTEEDVAAGLVNLLKHSQHFPDEFHQPLRIVNDVLARQVAHVPLKHFDSAEDLFPLLYVESQPVQLAAYSILHKQIPRAQEQISIDAALDKTTARLPEELLSLILESQTVAALQDADFERMIPLPLKGYLLSWLLVFDHLEHASFKVKVDYIDHLKEGDYLSGLLNFTFHFLGHADGKPIDVSKFDVTTYTPYAEPPKRELQWLLTHLYYLCLLHTPSLAKQWSIECKVRPIVVNLEPWTEKYISQPVIAAALQSVSDYATSEAESSPDSPFTIKVLPLAREITASYTIDDSTMTLRLTLPPSFPVSPATIEGLNRVAVSERTWQSWLRTSLGAITLFNGNLIDALTTFRRNVELAVRGQTECAICYAIVGSDKRLPDKRCGTCKHGFHAGCLFKWFRSSGGSSCPLCRNAFNYG